MPQPIRVPGLGVVNFPDDWGDEQIEAKVAELQQQSPGGETNAGATASASGEASPGGRRGEGLVEALPAIGGGVGSLLTGTRATPTGMLAAGVGGMVGEVTRQKIRQAQGVDPPPSMGRQAVEMMGPLGQIAANPEAVAAGLSQAGLEGVGRGAKALVEPAAKYLYKTALRPAMNLTRKYADKFVIDDAAVKGGTEKIVDEGFKHTIWPNHYGQRKAGRLLKAATADVDAKAASSPVPVDLAQAMQQGVGPFINEARAFAKATGRADVVPQIQQRVVRLAQAHPTGQVPATEALKMRRFSDDAVRKAKAAQIDFKAPILPDEPAKFDEAWGQGLNSQLRKIPGFQDASKLAQTRMGLYRASEDAANRPMELANHLAIAAAAAAVGGGGAMAGGPAGALGGGLGGAMAARMAMSPTARAGVAFAAPPLARHALRAADLSTGGEITSSTRDAIMAMMEDAMKRSTETP